MYITLSRFFGCKKIDFVATQLHTITPTKTLCFGTECGQGLKLSRNESRKMAT